MAKFYGKIGFSITKENPEGSGIWVADILEKEYYGDIEQFSRRWDDNEVNDNVSINCNVSVLSDPFAIDHYQFIKYVTLDGVKWKVSSVTPSYPRLTLTLGGLYND